MESKIVILPPPENNTGERIIRWFDEVGSEIRRVASLKDILKNHDVPLLVCIGYDDVFDRYLSDSDFPALLKKTIIYHLGHSDRSVRQLMSHNPGPKGYIGYKDEVAFLAGENERKFRNAFLSGFYALRNGENLQTAYGNTKNAWHELADGKTRKAWYKLANREEPLIASYAWDAFNKITFYDDDPDWRILAPTQIIILQQEIIDVEKPIVELVNFAPTLLQALERDPESIARLSPDKFEDLIAHALTKIGLEVQKWGSTYRRDGGIDLIAYPPPGSYPFLIAAQIKHSRKGRNVQPTVVRDLRGVMDSFPFDIGMIVTNTDFTPDARWIAAQSSRIIRLHNREDVKEWISGEIKGSGILREFPTSVEIAPGIVIPIPRTM